MLINVSKQKISQECSNNQVIPCLYQLYWSTYKKIKDHIEHLFTWVTDKNIKWEVVEETIVNETEEVIQLKIHIESLKLIIVDIPKINKDLEAKLNGIPKCINIQLSQSPVGYIKQSEMLRIKTLSLTIYIALNKSGEYVFTTDKEEYLNKTLEKKDFLLVLKDLMSCSEYKERVLFYIEKFMGTCPKTPEKLFENLLDIHKTCMNDVYYYDTNSVALKEIITPLDKIYNDFISYNKHLLTDKHKTYISSESKLNIFSKHINKTRNYLKKILNDTSYFTKSTGYNQQSVQNTKIRVDGEIRSKGRGVQKISQQVKKDSQRLYHPSMIGRFCPLDSPEGKRFGLLMGLANSIYINKHGQIFTKLKNIKTNEIEYVHPIEDTRSVLATNLDFESKEDVIFKITNLDFSRGTKNNVTHTMLSLYDFLSPSVILNPLIQFNDASRSIVANSIIKQTISTLNQSRFFYSSLSEYKNYLNVYEYSNISCCDNQIMNHAGVLKCNTNFIDLNFTCIPTTSVLGVYMHYGGKNFEDSICISDRLYKSGKIDSEKVFNIQISIRNKQTTTKDLPNNYKNTDHLDEHGIIKQHTRFGSEDILVGIVETREKPTDNYIDKILESLHLESEDLSNQSVYAPKYIRSGVVLYVSKYDVNGVTDNSQHIEQINKYYDSIIQKYKKYCKDNGLTCLKSSIDDIESDRSYELKHISDQSCKSVINIGFKVIRAPLVGDKLSALHGNKGVIGAIIPIEECPIMLGKNGGEPVDIIFNSISILARLNIGCLWEMELGQIKHAIENSGDIKSQLIKLQESGIECLIDNKDEISFLTRPYEVDIKTIKKIRKKLNIDQIKLINPINMKEYNRPVSCGYVHVLRNKNLVSEKISARDVGNYSIMTHQPSQKLDKMNSVGSGGGIRIGEMEQWAILGWNSPNVLMESFHCKSDDILARDSYNKQLLKTGRPVIRRTETETYKMLKIYLLLSGLNLTQE